MIDQDVYRTVRINVEITLQITTHCSESMLIASRDIINRDMQVRKPDMFDWLKRLTF